MTVRWTGFGEDVAGYPVTVNAWNRTANAGAGGWEQLASAQMLHDDAGGLRARRTRPRTRTPPATSTSWRARGTPTAPSSSADRRLQAARRMAPITVTWSTRGRVVELGRVRARRRRTARRRGRARSARRTPSASAPRPARITTACTPRRPRATITSPADGTFTFTAKPPVLTPVANTQITTGTASVLLAWSVPGRHARAVHVPRAPVERHRLRLHVGLGHGTNMPFAPRPGCVQLDRRGRSTAAASNYGTSAARHVLGHVPVGRR